MDEGVNWIILNQDVTCWESSFGSFFSAGGVAFALEKIWIMKFGCDMRYMQNGCNFWFEFLLGKFFAVNELFLRDESKLPTYVIAFWDFNG